MPWGIAASAAVGLYSANQQKKAGDKAAGAMQAGADAATAEQRRQYDQTRQDQMPWLTAGTSALSQLQQMNGGDYSSFKESPDYQFTFSQGMQGLDRSAAARGGLYSGGADADRIAYGQGMASQQYGNYYNRLANLAGVGQTTASGLGSMGMGMANQIGSNMISAGNARASAYGNRADANSQLAAGLGGEFNSWNQSRMAQKTTGYGAFTPTTNVSGSYGGLQPSNGSGWNFG